MAGDWIKMEAATPDKAEVLAITASMGWDDADLTVGKLFKVWRWFDQQTIDGNAPGVTVALLDRISGVPGFAEAMQNVGWLTISAAGITLPNFDRHNGKTAKARALTAKRVSKFKTGNAKGNAASVTSPLPREEKRREELESKSKALSSPPGGGDQPARSKKKKAARIYEPDSREIKAARYLLEAIRRHMPDHPEPKLQVWAEEFRKIFGIDGRDEDQVYDVIDFVTADPFWQPNVLSPGALRGKTKNKADKFMTIVAKMREPQGRREETIADRARRAW